MRKYYTRACNFYHGKAARNLIHSKKAFPLNGKKDIAFDKIEIFIREKNKVNSKIILCKDIKKLNKNNLEAILLHYPKDLLINKNHKLIQTLLDFKKNKIVKKIGVSIYEEKELEEILKIFKPDIIQCPINIFDNRLTKNNFLKKFSDKGIEIHARSIFCKVYYCRMGIKFLKNFQSLKSFLKNGKIG